MASHEATSSGSEEFAELQSQVLAWYGVEATDRYVDLTKPAMRLYVVEAGAGDPVVFVHGGGDAAMIWAPLLARMQDEFALYAPDRPGHGLSDEFVYTDVDLRRHATDFVCSLLDALELERAHVVACSAGAFFVLAAALSRPERFRKLVFVGYPLGVVELGPFWASPPAARRLQLVGGVPGFGTLFKGMSSRIDAEGVRQLYEAEFNADVSTYPDQYFEAWTAAIRTTGTMESFVSFIKRSMGLRGVTAEANLADDVTELAVPSLFLWGERDLAPVETGREAVDQISEATFEVVDGAGHFPFHDAPDWTAERITKFLAHD